jgi:hypothetical protein
MYAQIVTFSLTPDTSRAVFIDLTRKMCRWLERAEGFLAYELYEGAESCSDRIVWETEGHARDGLDAFIKTEMAEQMISMVENDYRSFFGKAVVEAG